MSMEYWKIEEEGKAIYLRPDHRLAKTLFYFGGIAFFVYCLPPWVSFNPLLPLIVLALALALVWANWGIEVARIDAEKIKIQILLGKLVLMDWKTVSLGSINEVRTEERKMMSKGHKWTEYVVTYVQDGKKQDLLPSLTKEAADFLVSFVDSVRKVR